MQKYPMSSEVKKAVTIQNNKKLIIKKIQTLSFKRMLLIISPCIIYQKTKLKHYHANWINLSHLELLETL